MGALTKRMGQHRGGSLQATGGWGGVLRRSWGEMHTNCKSVLVGIVTAEGQKRIVRVAWRPQ